MIPATLARPAERSAFWPPASYDPSPPAVAMPTESPPAPLLPRVATGDASAVRECISRYGGLVLALAKRFLGNTTDAEDVTQDVFVELWKHAHRFDPALASESTFVTVITRRRLIDHKRRSGRRPSPQELPESVAERPAASPFAGVDGRDDAARARRALDELRDDQRRVILLSVDDGLTHDQIADRTGLPVGTVKTHIRRGLMRVREVLAVPQTQEGGGQ